MGKKDRPFLSRLGELLRRPGFWTIILLFIIFTVPHYSEAYGYPAGLGTLMSAIGLTRHAMERILFMIPIVWSGFLFGTKGTIISSLAALACMLPRAILISEYQADALFETAAVTIVGGFVSGLSAFSLRLLNRERDYVSELEEAHQELFNLRFRLATKQLVNHRELPRVRKKIARLKMIIRERELAKG